MLLISSRSTPTPMIRRFSVREPSPSSAGSGCRGEERPRSGNAKPSSRPESSERPSSRSASRTDFSPTANGRERACSNLSGGKNRISSSRTSRSITTPITGPSLQSSRSPPCSRRPPGRESLSPRPIARHRSSRRDRVRGHLFRAVSSSSKYSYASTRSRYTPSNPARTIRETYESSLPVMTDFQSSSQ
jgi:hypothetical protein